MKINYLTEFPDFGEMPSQRAFIATSNMELSKLTPRFATRLQRHTVEAPEAGEIAGLLVARGLPAAVAGQIAFLCGGCVRAALLDSDAWLGAAQVKARRAVASKTQLSFA